eukprot:14359494-Alexandrium_andersonii.AAC.1
MSAGLRPGLRRRLAPASWSAASLRAAGCAALAPRGALAERERAGHPARGRRARAVAAAATGPTC